MKTSTIIKPIITEKSMQDAMNGVYTFQVDPLSSKHSIRSAIEKAFSVNIEKINTSTKKPTTKRTGRKRLKTSTKKTKKATVWLKKGQKIEIFEFKEK